MSANHFKCGEVFKPKILTCRLKNCHEEYDFVSVIVSVWVWLFLKLHCTFQSKEPRNHSFSCRSDFFWQFYNSLCRNLPRRYVLPLTLDEQTPLDQNLVTLHNYKATAKKTKPGEVGWNRIQYAHSIYKVICLTVNYTQSGFTGIK